jgi:hypothetical protein
MDLLDMIKRDEEPLEIVLSVTINKKLPLQDRYTKWMLQIVKPFLLSMVNEPKYDYCVLM